MAPKSQQGSRFLLVALASTCLAAGLYARNLDDYFLADDFELIRSFYEQPVGYYAKLLVHNESGDAWEHLGLGSESGGYLRPVKIWLLALDYRADRANKRGFLLPIS
jgi:hypothetical protein